jgi:Xaa-Pro aminopeptidase
VDGGADVPAPLRNLGIRIEDDVLVTRTGHRVLSAAIPKEADAVERVMAGD